MKFVIARDDLYPALSLVSGAVERRPTHPILANVLLALDGEQLVLKATDTELELIGRIDGAVVESGGQTTVSAQKLLDVCRALPAKSDVRFSLNDQQQLIITSGHVRFSLATLPAASFPAFDEDEAQFECTVSAGAFKHLIDQSHFSMGVQDVRFYLNGMLLELTPEHLRCVSSDGHRISKATEPFAEPIKDLEQRQLILPRKGVYELQKLLAGVEDDVRLCFLENSLRVELPKFRFLTKVIDSKYPDYRQVFSVSYEHQLVTDVVGLKDALSRVAILSNDKYRTVVLTMNSDHMLIQAHNPSQEESHDKVTVEYTGPEVEIGFNVDYLLDILGTLNSEAVNMSFINDKKSVLLEGVGDDQKSRYMVMPRSI